MVFTCSSYFKASLLFGVRTELSPPPSHHSKTEEYSPFAEFEMLVRAAERVAGGVP